jgi:Lrp/AsnC family transcriptional regulator, regulator for asnA, asnC and gidA
MTPARAAAATRPGAVRLDARDEAIIAELQRDGRASFAVVARTVGMSEAAVRQRVHRLTRAEAIRITAVTAPDFAGADRLAVIGIRCRGNAVETAEALSAMAELHRIALTRGAFNVLAEAAYSGDGHLLELIQRVRGRTALADVEVFIALRQYLPRRESLGGPAPRRPPAQP